MEFNRIVEFIGPLSEKDSCYVYEDQDLGVVFVTIFSNVENGFEENYDLNVPGRSERIVVTRIDHNWEVDRFHRELIARSNCFSFPVGMERDGEGFFTIGFADVPTVEELIEEYEKDRNVSTYEWALSLQSALLSTRGVFDVLLYIKAYGGCSMTDCSSKVGTLPEKVSDIYNAAEFSGLIVGNHETEYRFSIVSHSVSETEKILVQRIKDRTHLSSFLKEMASEKKRIGVLQLTIALKNLMDHKILGGEQPKDGDREEPLLVYALDASQKVFGLRDLAKEKLHDVYNTQVLTPVRCKIADIIAGPTSRLDFVRRYSSIPTNTTEYTSTHSFWVAFYSAIIHNEYGLKSIDGEVVPEEKIYLKAIIHDLAEAVTGDVVRPFKYVTKELKKEVDRAESIMVDKLFPKAVKDLFEQAEGNLSPAVSTYISEVIKAADFCSLYMYMRREVMTGNKLVKPFFKIMMDDLEKRSLMKTIAPRMSEIYDELYKESVLLWETM